MKISERPTTFLLICAKCQFRNNYYFDILKASFVRPVAKLHANRNKQDYAFFRN